MEDFDFAEFKKRFDISKYTLCREVFQQNQESIKIKNEKRAVENLYKIFNAVFSISSKKGFQAMTMRDLSREANLSMGALYAYFKNKEDLLHIVQKQGRTMVKNVLDTFESTSVNPLGKLRAVIKAHIFLSEVARPWFFFTFMEARNLSEKELKEVREVEAHTEKVIVDILIFGESEGVFKKRNHFLTASIIKSMQQDWYLKRWKYKSRQIDPDEFSDYVTGFVESFVLVEPNKN
ncbi:MAG: TetR/AcrR family transcriptional regulator [Desulfobacteraceae bacterium]|nr:TetR/AcrR family transcriptional regulator [Desulfobacteraceae bacterium]